MLNPQDIEFMRQSLRDIQKLRTRDIEIITASVATRHPITGEPTFEKVSKLVPAVVTEITGQSGSAVERYIREGIAIMDGDLWFSVDLDYIEYDGDIYKELVYEGQRYIIVANDRKGIGERNRIEFLARLAK